MKSGQDAIMRFLDENNKKEKVEVSGQFDIQKNFPAELAEMLRFIDRGDHIRVETRKFLGSDNFAKIASVIRDLDGEYVSQGKQSHFKVPKKA